MTATSVDETTRFRRLDHIAILVSSTDEALAYYRDRLGFPVVAEEAFETPPVRLTYVDCGNALIQLLEPTGDSPLSAALAEKGEGIHHICFSADDVVGAAVAHGDEGAGDPIQGKGRGRGSAFVPGPIHHGVLVEVTEFHPDDVEG
jgi:methylmalonyl-CoA/ethylmalonyl-CoA epimerase